MTHQNTRQLLVKLNRVFVLSAVFLLFTCSQPNSASDHNKNHQSELCRVVPDFSKNVPKLEFKISMEDSNIERGDKIEILMQVRNIDTCAYRLLLNHPQHAQYGPWATSATVVKSSTGMSVVEYEDASILSSTLYLESQLDSFKYILHPNTLARHEAELNEIVMFNQMNKVLDTGTYKVQLRYYDVKSNELSFTIN